MNAALKPAAELAQHDRRYPNESADYRRARTALLAQEIELRRLTERVAAQRRTLPAGGKVPEDYSFQGSEGPIKLSQLFGRHDTLITYNWMFGPQRKEPCPMCTSLLSALDGEMPDVLQQVAFVVVAASPVQRLQDFARQRGWRHLRLVSSAGSSFNKDYAFEEPGGDNAAFNVFQRDGDTVRHFWGDEMGMESADPGQDPRGAVYAMPIWGLLDITPRGRAPDWYPKLNY